MVGGSLVIVSTVSCPDSSCQKLVDQENQKAEQKKVSFMFAKAQTEEIRLKAKTQNP